MGERRHPAVLWLVAAASLAVVSAACTAPAGSGTSLPNRAPVINGIAISSASPEAPQLATLSWLVSDPDGDTLTCSLDSDLDGNVDEVIEDCGGPGSRNRLLVDAGTHSAELVVDDGEAEPVSESAAIMLGVGPTESFDIELRPLSPLGATEQAAFDAAEARWEAALLRGVPDVDWDVAAGECLAGAAEITDPIDDLILDIEIAPIDGPGGVLGQAGPCITESSDRLPRMGLMSFDSDDVAGLIAAGTLDEVVVHEMGHVLGLGTLWNYYRTLIAGKDTPNARYFGVAAMAEYDVLGAGTIAVPVETTGGAGTANSHWRESVFDNELMTGYIDAGINPLSAMSIASLSDLGYQVDPSVADAYSLPGSGFLNAPASRSSSAQIELGEVTRPVITSRPG